MKKFFNWAKHNQDIVFRLIYSIPVFLAIFVSINHCITYFSISNPISWAIFLSVSVEIVALTTLVALILGKNSFSMVLTFIVITIVQIIGNIFYSFNYIDESGILFRSWYDFINIVFIDNEMSIDRHKLLLSTAQGSIVPLLSLLSIHLIYSFKLKDVKQEEIKEMVGLDETKTDVVDEKPTITPLPKIKKALQPLKPIVKPTVENTIDKEEEKVETPKEFVVKTNNENKVFYEDMGKQPTQINKQRKSLLPRIKIGNKK